MLKLDGLASFVAVAEAGSISAAVRRLGLSKSVVSDRLAEVERTLGAPLLHRTTRKLSLTEDGAAFLEWATRIVREVEEATADMAQRRGTLVGPLRVSAPVTFGRMHLGPALYPFLVQHPELELTLELDDRRVDAAADSFDAVVRPARRRSCSATAASSTPTAARQAGVWKDRRARRSCALAWACRLRRSSSTWRIRKGGAPRPSCVPSCSASSKPSVRQPYWEALIPQFSSCSQDA